MEKVKVTRNGRTIEVGKRLGGGRVVIKDNRWNWKKVEDLTATQCRRLELAFGELAAELEGAGDGGAGHQGV